jgi:hypothetical protein
MFDPSKVQPRTWAAAGAGFLALLLLLPNALVGERGFPREERNLTVVQPPESVAVLPASQALDPVLPAFAGAPPVDPFTLEARVAAQRAGALPLPSPPALDLPSPPLLPLPAPRSPAP